MAAEDLDEIAAENEDGVDAERRETELEAEHQVAAHVLAQTADLF
jgi:hypothetical protein